MSALSADEPEGVDSGFSDSATPTHVFSEDSQDARMATATNNHAISAQDEDAILEDAADLNLPKEEENPSVIE